MKLQSYTLISLSAILPMIISVWAVIFYYEMLDEVYDSIDDGLDNYKILIIDAAEQDTSVLQKNQFRESNYAIRRLPTEEALKIREVHQDTLMYSKNEKENEPYRMLTTAFLGVDGNYYELKIASSMVEEDDLIEDLLYSMIWLYVAILLTILLLNNLILKHIWKPFRQLLRQLNQFRLGKAQLFVPPPTRVQEFQDMNQTIEVLLRRNTATYQSQKQFIENAAHELQTPVAISINKLELLLEQEHLKDTHVEAIGDVIQTMERLNRLNKSLLLLSRIENQQFIESEHINFNSIIQSLVKEFYDYMQFKNISITYTESGQLDCLMNKDLATILATNLIKNAIIHNISGGKVNILLTAHSFVIENNGAKVALDKMQIFNRFYKKSEQQQGTGLGLAIVKAIVDFQGFKINYTFSGLHKMEIFITPNAI